MSSERITELLRVNVGISAASLGAGVMERAIARRMKVVGAASTQEYEARLHQSNAELQELVEEVVVPETSFFRDRGAFAALVKWVQNDWFAAARPERLEIASIPCSTGEEPYSIVMALLAAGVPGHTFAVTGLDISARALNQARRGLYRSGSFRGRELGYRERYFDRVGDAYHIKDEVKELVRFKKANLLGPEPVERTSHVVFCRNLLIYFDQVAQEDAMRKLDALLAPGGLLFLGPAETFLARAHDYRPLGVPLSFGFRKAAGVTALPEPARPRPRRRISTPPASLPAARRMTQPPAAVRTKETDFLGAAERHADRGEVLEAAELCRKHLALKGPDPRAYFLLALAADATGNADEAISCYRKVLYLDPQHEQALLHLSTLLGSRGQHAQAVQLQRRARRDSEVQP